MFESLAPPLAEVDDAALIDVIAGSAREEAAAAARRWAAVAELTERRCNSELAEARQYWACDAWDSAAAEIAAAQSISHRAASKQMHQGLALRHRLPRMAALLAEGAISASMAATLTWRAHLVDDAEVLAALDADLATIIDTWGRLSSAKLQTEVDALIERHDPLRYWPITPRPAVGTCNWVDRTMLQAQLPCGPDCYAPMPKWRCAGSMRWRVRCVTPIPAAWGSDAPTRWES